MKNPYLAASLVLGSALAADAASIAVNFSENDTNQSWQSVSTPIGPTGIASQYFNNTNNPPGGTGLPVRTGTLAAGSMALLVDSAGAATAASVSWSSANAWYTSVGTGSNQAILGVGYLDDGGNGVSITLTNIPYAQYRVYGLLASDQGGGVPATNYTAGNFLVNGVSVLGGTATAYRNIDDSTAAAGSPWTLLTSTQVGNYWVSSTQTSATLTIAGGARAGDARGSLAGFIVEQVPEPSSAVFFAGALSAMALRRRRA